MVIDGDEWWLMTILHNGDYTLMIELNIIESHIQAYSNWSNYTENEIVIYHKFAQEILLRDTCLTSGLKRRYGSWQPRATKPTEKKRDILTLANIGLIWLKNS